VLVVGTTIFPPDSFVVPRRAQGVWLRFFGCLAFCVLGGIFIAFGSGLEDRLIGAFGIIVFGCNVAMQAGHLNDGPEMAFSRDGILHRDFGLLPWDRVHGIRYGQGKTFLFIDVDDVAGIARANGRRVRLFDRIRLRINQRTIFVAAPVVRPMTLDQIVERLAYWSGRPFIPGQRAAPPRPDAESDNRL
jgi:hypothetical protein